MFWTFSIPASIFACLARIPLNGFQRAELYTSLKFNTCTLYPCFFSVSACNVYNSPFGSVITKLGFDFVLDKISIEGLTKVVVLPEPVVPITSVWIGLAKMTSASVSCLFTLAATGTPSTTSHKLINLVTIKPALFLISRGVKKCVSSKSLLAFIACLPMLPFLPANHKPTIATIIATQAKTIWPLKTNRFEINENTVVIAANSIMALTHKNITIKMMYFFDFMR